MTAAPGLITGRLETEPPARRNRLAAGWSVVSSAGGGRSASLDVGQQPPPDHPPGARPNNRALCAARTHAREANGRGLRKRHRVVQDGTVPVLEGVIGRRSVVWRVMVMGMMAGPRVSGWCGVGAPQIVGTRGVRLRVVILRVVTGRQDLPMGTVPVGRFMIQLVDEPRAGHRPQPGGRGHGAAPAPGRSRHVHQHGCSRVHGRHPATAEPSSGCSPPASASSPPPPVTVMAVLPRLVRYGPHPDLVDHARRAHLTARGGTGLRARCGGRRIFFLPSASIPAGSGSSQARWYTAHRRTSLISGRWCQTSPG